MGVDALDIGFRLEKEFGLRQVTRAWPTAGLLYDGRPDLTAADLAALVTRLLGRTPVTAVDGAVLTPAAGRLDYESRVGGAWPPVAAYDPAVWPGVCRVLEAALGVTAADIVPQTRLVRDLGMG